MTQEFVLKVFWSFLRAFLASFIVLVPGILAAPNLTAAKSLAIAAVVGALAAGFRAIQSLLTKSEAPASDSGVLPPPS